MEIDASKLSKSELYVVETYNKATNYLEQNKWKKAFPILKKLNSEFEFKEGLCNLGLCYRNMGDHKREEECYRLALDDKTPYMLATGNAHLHAMNNLGLALYGDGDDKAAVSMYSAILREDKERWESWFNCSLAKLRMCSDGRRSDWMPVWEMYRARFLKGAPVVLKNRKEGLVYWDLKKPPPGTKMIVLVEQGIGDAIMWGRYLASLAAIFEKIYVQCDPSLNDLFSDYNPVMDAIDTDADVAYPICSLSECFNGGVPIPGEWLKGKFDARKFDSSSKPNVGIVWSGNPTHANDRYRSTNVGRFSRLSKFANLYCLTPGFKGNKYVKSLGIKSWKDTAECINGLDLVISVDTSVIHLAGALGAEAWLLQPYRETDFRWGNGVERSLWYDSVRIFPNPQSWETVFDNVERELIAFASK